MLKLSGRLLNNYMKMKIQNLLLLLFCFSLVGCFSTRQAVLKDLSSEIIELPFKIDSLTITDAREELLPMDWDVPMFGTKKREWIGNPPLSDMNRADIEHIVLRSGSADGVPAELTFRILEGVCQLNGDWKSVSEYAQFKGELTLHIPSRNYTYTSYAEMYYDNPTVNGTEKGTLRLYNQAVKNVTHMILKQIRDDVKM